MPIPVFGDISGAVSGLSVPLDIAIKNYSPTLFRNSLSISLRQISSYGQFRQYLKNHLFGI